MSTAEVFAKYPNPGALLRQLEGGRNAAGQQQQCRSNAGGNDRTGSSATRAAAKDCSELYREYDLKPGQPDPAADRANRVLRAVYSERQLQEVMVDFWQNHFNVFSGKAAVRWYIPSYERDVLERTPWQFQGSASSERHSIRRCFSSSTISNRSRRTHRSAGGNAATSAAADAERPQIHAADARADQAAVQVLTDAQLDERLKQMRSPGGSGQPRSRHKRELRPRADGAAHARRRRRLHAEGHRRGRKVPLPAGRSPIRAAIGVRRPTMIQGTEDRRIDRLQRPAGVPDDVESGEFYFNDAGTISGTKTVLGQKIDEGGIKDGLKVIDILVKHPSTAKFIARKLAVKFVSDNPSEGSRRTRRRCVSANRTAISRRRCVRCSPTRNSSRRKIIVQRSKPVSSLRSARSERSVPTRTRPGDARDAEQARRGALRLSGSDRLSGHGRRLGQHRCLARTAEFRRRRREQSHPGNAGRSESR